MTDVSRQGASKSRHCFQGFHFKRYVQTARSRVRTGFPGTSFQKTCPDSQKTCLDKISKKVAFARNVRTARSHVRT
jgi:hypothetical protein